MAGITEGGICLKTLLIITSRYPHEHDSVSGVFVHSQVRELKRHFERVVVICTLPSVPKWMAGMMAPKRKLDSMARDYSFDNVEVHYVRNVVLPFHSSKIRRGDAAYAKVKKLVTGLRPDIVHAHYAWPSGYIAMRLKEELGWPYIITGHGYDIYDLPFRSADYHARIRKALAGASAIISVSSENARIITDKLRVPGKIRVIPNGYNPGDFHDMDRQKCRRKLGLPLDRKIVLTVGYLAPEKGQDRLIDTARELPDALFVLIGDGTDRGILEKKIREYGLEGSVLLKGKKTHREIPFWMNAADLLAIPSRAEGVPSVLFEALGCGIPVVAMAVGGIPDIITEDSYGRVVPPEGSLKDALSWALGRDWNRSAIIEYSRRFEWSEISRSILDLYNEVHSDSERGGRHEQKN